MSDMLRITGMASGLDTESMVQKLMKAENMKVDKVKQDRQTIQWKQDLYRDILGDLSSFKSTYFDVLKPESNVLSGNNYAGFDVTSSDTTNTIVTANAGAGAVPGTYKVKVNQVAAGAINEGSALTISGSTATRSATLSQLGLAADTSINITYNGTTKAVAIKTTDTIDNVIQNINSTTSGNVIAKFSELTGKFSVQTSATGSKTAAGTDNTIGIDNIAALGIASGNSVIGKDAIVEITPPGSLVTTTVTKPNNAFTIDGISYSVLQKDLGSGVNLTVSANVNKTFDKIKSFIDKYNEIIDKVNKKIDEKVEKDYKPLTDDQKKSMKDEDIKAWEAKAKQGLLKNDSNLQGMLNSMRTAFFDKVEGAGLSLRDLGLSTSSDTSQRGKIIFDISLGGEQKLKDAIQNNGQQVADLFMKTSTITYSPDLSQSDRATRNNNEGIFQRINDILQDYTRTTRDTNGKKGNLLEKAGIKGDFTEFNNLLSKQLKDQDKLISDLTKKLSDKENSYYNKFSKLETAMNNMNSQSSWLSQQLGGGK